MKKFILCTAAIVMAISLMFTCCAVVYAQAESDTADEGLSVSKIYDSLTPDVHENKLVCAESLSVDEKLIYTAKKFLPILGTAVFDGVSVKTEEFRAQYKKMFNKEMPDVNGKELDFDPQYKLVFSADGVAFSCDPVSGGKADVRFLFDYKFKGNTLTVREGIAEKTDELNLPEYNYKTTAETEPGAGFAGELYIERNYFSASTDRTLGEKYASAFTVYIQTYEKGADGEWHWVSCEPEVKNPETSDGNILIAASAAALLAVSYAFAVSYSKKKEN